MTSAVTTILLGALSGAALSTMLVKADARLRLSRAKHRSLAGHSKLARWLAGQIPFYDYDRHRFFRSDSPPEELAARREAGFTRLATLFAQRFGRGIEQTAALREQLSDLRFTSAYRVPFQYSRVAGEALQTGAFLEVADGVTVTDIDGNRFFDLTGSYGVNLFGQDFYRACIAEGARRVEALGPVLGFYHPLVAANVARLRALSGLDEVSFHMSGTEAVMQAVRLARYHTGRSHLVRFCGAYHGWWGDVQPGIGNPVPAERTYTLAEMSERTLRVLAQRKDIACVLVNPLQALHPNAAAPADSALIDSSRRAGVDREAYTAWLHRLREVCTRNGIVLILDDIFMGFRLARGGAAEYFNIRPDMISYGKTLGGGLPVGVLCGRAVLMKRYRDERPVDICFARGTFNAHPYVMGAMSAFLDRLDSPEVAQLYDGLDDRWQARADHLNRRLGDAGLPVRIANLSSVWTICYTRPSRYNWMLQYYLRAEGVALSWVGTGRVIFSLNYGDADVAEVAERFVRAGRAMAADGWWEGDPALTDKTIRRQILREILSVRLGRGPRPGRSRPPRSALPPSALPATAGGAPSGKA